jgi:hypothetical protein
VVGAPAFGVNQMTVAVLNYPATGQPNESDSSGEEEPLDALSVFILATYT